MDGQLGDPLPPQAGERGQMNPIDTWFDTCTNPLKSLMEDVRRVILAADARISETIKWQTPTFEYKGPMVSFNPRSKAHVSLMFHKGAMIPGRFALLEGDGKEARTMRISDPADLASKTSELQAITRAWCDMKDG